MQTKTTSPEVLRQIFSEKFQRRFWKKVKVGALDECWPWIGAMWKGYGYIRVGKGEEKCKRRAHRISWIVKNGVDVPLERLVLHTCISNPACCNPDHLYIGDELSNMQDRKKQGHYSDLNQGEAHGMSRFTEGQVIEMRAMHSSGKLQSEIARHFLTSQGTVQKIISRERWAHI